jgi:hypothetical protein
MSLFSSIVSLPSLQTPFAHLFPLSLCLFWVVHFMKSPEGPPSPSLPRGAGEGAPAHTEVCRRDFPLSRSAGEGARGRGGAYFAAAGFGPFASMLTVIFTSSPSTVLESSTRFQMIP